MAMLARRFNRFLGVTKKGGQKFRKFNRTTKPQKDDKGKNKLICYKCSKPGHIQAKCLELSEKQKERTNTRPDVQ